MNYFVLATHAVTVDGEWVTPESVQQVDFDSLLCIYCKLQIGVQFNPLTSTKTFVHIPRHINNVARLKTCRFNKFQTVPEQTSPKTIPPPRATDVSGKAPASPLRSGPRTCTPEAEGLLSGKHRPTASPPGWSRWRTRYRPR